MRACFGGQARDYYELGQRHQAIANAYRALRLTQGRRKAIIVYRAAKIATVP